MLTIEKLPASMPGRGTRYKQIGHPPDQAASLFSLAANPADEWPEWIQPTGAHNAYAVGDKVTHDSKRWISTADANTWMPGEYGWEEVV